MHQPSSYSSSVQHALQLKELANNCLSPVFDFNEPLYAIEKLFLDLARNEIPVMHQSSVLSQIRCEFNQLENFCKGIQLLGVLPHAIALHFVHVPDQLVHYIVSQAEAFAAPSEINHS
ncbi:MAG: hypothetical protein FJX83_00395 [Bacteroidetes bacterium]|nr:hypothetical protein [Bacteroidota bacterium]